MLLNHFNCYKVSNKSTHFHEEKNVPKFKVCELFFFLYQCSLSSNGKKLNFSILNTCNNIEQYNAYHTGSEFTHHYNMYVGYQSSLNCYLYFTKTQISWQSWFFLSL